MRLAVKVILDKYLGCKLLPHISHGPSPCYDVGCCNVNPMHAVTKSYLRGAEGGYMHIVRSFMDRAKITKVEDALK